MPSDADHAAVLRRWLDFSKWALPIPRRAAIERAIVLLEREADDEPTGRYYTSLGRAQPTHEDLAPESDQLRRERES